MVSSVSKTGILSPHEAESFSVVNPEGKAKCMLICEHASNRIPESLDNLGLSEEYINGHMAWDLGTGQITSILAEILDAPAVLANYSRLVIDANRRLDHPTSISTNCEGEPIPANVGITAEDRDLRVNEIYEPYHKAIDDLVDGFKTRDIIPALISVHSFEPVFYKLVRPWEIGVLWVQDPRMPLPVIEHFREMGFTVGDNEPYDARILRGTTINHHADGRGLPNVLVEIRNDLIDTDEKIQKWAQMLGECFKLILQDESLYSYYDGPQAVHEPGREDSYFDELVAKAKRGE